MQSPKRMLARLIASAGLAICSVVAVAEPAAAGTITAQECTDRGGTLVDHNSWTGCAGITKDGQHIKVVG